MSDTEWIRAHAPPKVIDEQEFRAKVLGFCGCFLTELTAISSTLAAMREQGDAALATHPELRSQLDQALSELKDVLKEST